MSTGVLGLALALRAGGFVGASSVLLTVQSGRAMAPGEICRPG